MARCWTCGREVAHAGYQCPECQGVAEIKGLRGDVADQTAELSSVVERLRDSQDRGLEDLQDATREGFRGIATVLEWGFGELRWAAELQGKTLRSIDQTLKTPGETQANEWREMAEELRRRGVFDESEEFYLRSIEANRLDFRAYVGLAQTYLQSGRFADARDMLVRSLPHAPKAEIDYRSYSHRLLGHLDACEESYEEAHEHLREAVRLSPDYPLARYDLAQYSALIERADESKTHLEGAILREPGLWYLAEAEPNFDAMRAAVSALLAGLLDDEAKAFRGWSTLAATALQEAEAAVAAAVAARDAFDPERPIESEGKLTQLRGQWRLLEVKAAEGDYLKLLACNREAPQIIATAKEIEEAAAAERRRYEADLKKRELDAERARERAEAAEAQRLRSESDAQARKQAIAKNRAIVVFFLVGIPLSLCGALQGCTAALGSDAGGLGIGMLLGGLLALVFGGGLAALLAYAVSK